MLYSASKSDNSDLQLRSWFKLTMMQRQDSKNEPAAASPNNSGGAGSFGSRFRKSWQRLTSDASEQAAENNADEDDGISELLNEVDQNGSSILLRRADQISVSYYSSTPREDDANKILSEFEIITTDTYPAVINAINDREGLLSQHINSCCSLDGSEQSPTFMKAGDVVVYACGVDCRRLDQSGSDALNSSSDEVDDDTPTEDTANNNIDVNDKIATIRSAIRSNDTTVCVSTTKSSNDPILLCQATVLFSKKEILDEIADMQMSNLKSGGVEAISCLNVGISFSQHDDRLTIGAISKNEGSWFRSKGCAIREGDIVVGINEFIASNLSPQDATSFIHDILSSPKTCHLSISTIASTRLTGSTRWDKIRKAAVTAGGGTLVASGAMLMVTPLHPVGHAMALGGMGMLGTECEAPKKALNSVKERFTETRQIWNERRKASAGSNSDSCSSASKQEKGNSGSAYTE